MKKPIHRRIKKALSTPEYVKILTLRTIGNFLVLASIFMIAKTFYKPVYEEVRYFIDQKTGKTYVVAGTDVAERVKRDYGSAEPRGLLSDFLSKRQVEILTPNDPNFSLIIPAIGANANIVANVDPGSERAYLKALKRGVAHAAGTALPGEDDHIFLFAHSTDYPWNVGIYNAVFYLLYKLEPGDEVNIFYKGQRFVYRVEGTKVVNPGEVEYLTRKTDSEFLTLQTCTPPGTTFKRLLVFARRVAE